MKTYLVGGANRSILMGQKPNDMDYVIVGATEEDIQNLLDEGYKQVGQDFPVFLSPKGEEFALARTERKIGKGHNAFKVVANPKITLIEDLARRDLTINSIAFDMETLEVIDPFNGQGDIEKKWIRHTTEAFCEDPLRALRAARFNACFGKDWNIHPHTKDLMRQMSYCGELEALTAERVWKEMHKALASNDSYIFFLELKDLIFKEVDAMFGIPQNAEHHPEIDTYVHTIMCLQEADKRKLSPKIKLALLCHDFGKPICHKTNGNLHGHEAAGVPIAKAFCEKYKVPKEYKEFALMVTEFHTKAHSVFGRGSSEDMTPKTIMKLMEQTGAIRDPESFYDFLLACECDARGRKGFEDKPYPQRPFLTECLNAILAVDSKSISSGLLSKGKSGILIGEAIRVARIAAIRAVTYTFNRDKVKTT